MSSNSSTEPPLWVTRFDSNERFLVRSEVDASVHYIVELNAFGDRARCPCEDFSIRIESRLLKGEQPEKYECKHCLQVRAVLEAAALYCAQARIPFDISMIGKSR